MVVVQRTVNRSLFPQIAGAFRVPHRPLIALRPQDDAHPPIDPALAKIVAAWPKLPEPIRRAMIALIG